jgi:hypothetical protein
MRKFLSPVDFSSPGKYQNDNVSHTITLSDYMTDFLI